MWADRQITGGKRISLRDYVILRNGHNAVGDKSSFSAKENDLSGLQLG